MFLFCLYSFFLFFFFAVVHHVWQRSVVHRMRSSRISSCDPCSLLVCCPFEPSCFDKNTVSGAAGLSKPFWLRRFPCHQNLSVAVSLLVQGPHFSWFYLLFQESGLGVSHLSFLCDMKTEACLIHVALDNTISVGTVFLVNPCQCVTHTDNDLQSVKVHLYRIEYQQKCMWLNKFKR